MGSLFTSSQLIVYVLVLQTLLASSSLLKTNDGFSSNSDYISAIGDPGMKNPNVRVGFEAWNFSNEVGFEAPQMGRRRLADCADLYCNNILTDSLGGAPFVNGRKCEVHHKVNESDHSLGTGDKFPVTGFVSFSDPDLFAVEKELYLGSLCEVHESTKPWQFWMIMLKNGNFDKNTTLCPENGRNVSKIVTGRNFPCFGKGCMNQPLVYHNYS
ncbi:hypothetical protein Ddye_005524 [Dipteronia dyeriana]|uniref:DUF7705 domain-containing protein n=1 Tax=Dipteronia dyeriana TaxID=168575 RepID=A0AAE0CPT1_9ROSI|nr:hypothetical protein Ddye_005524 [Dipteronia dyeriana]